MRFLIAIFLCLPLCAWAGESWHFHQRQGPLLQEQTAAGGDPEPLPDQLSYAPQGGGFGAGLSAGSYGFGIFELSNGGSICVRSRPGEGGCIVNFTRDELFLLDRRSGGKFPVRMRFSLKP